MKRAGQQSSVLNVDPRAPESKHYIKISGARDFLWQLIRHVANNWELSVHTNGHNRKSWAIALACGLAAQCGPGATLTLHSGLAPDYIRRAPRWQRGFFRLACGLYRQVTCVNSRIATALAGLGVAGKQLLVTPAFLPIEAPDVALPPEMQWWFRSHSPVLTATMFFRPEYGFDLLLEAVARLKDRYPRIGCLVMGSGEAFVNDPIRDSILLAGDLNHELCLALIARSDVFVRPTLQDGDSISVREAVALRVPVVASNVGTRPEGVTLFDAGDVDGLVEGILRAIEKRTLICPN